MAHHEHHHQNHSQLADTTTKMEDTAAENYYRPNRALKAFDAWLSGKQ